MSELPIRLLLGLFVKTLAFLLLLGTKFLLVLDA